MFCGGETVNLFEECPQWTGHSPVDGTTPISKWVAKVREDGLLLLGEVVN